MKKPLSFIPLFLVTGILFSQDWSGKVYSVGKIYDGYYVTLSHDTVPGYIYHGNKAGNQKECLYYKNEKDAKPASKFKVDDILAWKVADKVYRAIHYSGGLTAKPLRFVLVTKDGPISEFVFYSESGPGEDKTVYHKAHDPKNDEPKELQYFGVGFQKKMSEYVADYPELSKKVANKEKGYGLLKILEIIAEYNAWYLNK